MTPEELLTGLRTKYPQYKNIPDTELLPKLVAKYPQYQKQLVQPSNAQEPSKVPENDFIRRQVPDVLAKSPNVIAQVGGQILRNLPYQDYKKPTTPEEMTDVVLNASPMGVGGIVEKVAQRSGLEQHILDLLKKGLPIKNQALAKVAEKDPIQAIKSGLSTTDWPKVDKWLNEVKRLGTEGPELDALIKTKAKGLIDEINGAPSVEVLKGPAQVEAPKQIVPAVRDPQTGQVYTGPSHNEIMASVTDPNAKRAVMREVTGKTENTGFLDVNGQFINRMQAQEKYGFSTSEELAAKEQATVQPSTSLKMQKALEIKQSVKELPDAPPFYSKLNQVLSDPKTPPVMPAEGLLNRLRQAGVKPEELEWSGVEGLVMGKQKVTKQEVQTFLEESPFNVNEVVHGDKGKGFMVYESATGNPAEDTIFSSRAEAEEFIGHQDRPDADFFIQTEGVPQVSSTRYQDYQLPGGKNYREFLFQLPLRKGQKIDTFKTAPKEVQDLYIKFEEGHQEGDGYTKKDGERFLKKLNALGYDVDRPLTEFINYEEPSLPGIHKIGNIPTFQSGHFDEPNVLAHARANDRKIGKDKVLFLEEVQSDWHQAGREKGYFKPSIKTTTIVPKLPTTISFDPPRRFPRGSGVHMKVNVPEIDLTLEYSPTQGWALMDNTHGNAIQIPQYINEEHEAKVWVQENLPTRWNAIYTDNNMLERGQRTNQVPDAPFKKTWPDLVLKRMIRRAVEEGKDGIAWTSGTQQADRYNLAKYVDRIDWAQTGDRTYSINAIKRGNKVLQRARVTVEELPNLVGKDVAAKILSHKDAITGRTGWKSGEVKGKDLAVGGGGMKAFYDQILPYKANDLVKRWGAKVEQRPFQQKAVIETPSIDIMLDEIPQTVQERMDAKVNRMTKEEFGKERWQQVQEGLDDAELTDFEREQKIELMQEWWAAHKRPKAAKKEMIHYLKFTTELKHAVMKVGFPLFGVLAGAGLAQDESSLNTTSLGAKEGLKEEK